MTDAKIDSREIERGKTGGDWQRPRKISMETERQRERWNDIFEHCFINTADICLSLFHHYCHISKGYPSVSEGDDGAIESSVKDGKGEGEGKVKSAHNPTQMESVDNSHD